MPKIKQIIEFDYGEFQDLCIKTLGFEADFSIIATMEWGNDECHDFSLDADELENLSSYEREKMDEIYAAAKDYQTALALNSGVDPYAFYPYPKPPENKLIREARVRLYKATQFDLHTIALCLMEQGALQAGDHIINISW